MLQTILKASQKMSPNNQKYNFSGKVALVTGSSTGIGEAIALQLAQYGAKVVITGRDAAKLAKVALRIEQVSGGVAPVQVIGDFLADDHLPKKLIDQTIAKFGQLDVLVNNAGGASPNDKLANPNLLQEFDNVFKLNVRSVVALTQLAVPYLEKTKGNIINISSAASIAPIILSYCSAKAALDMVTKTSALELGPKGIRVNSINPGPVVSEFARSLGVVDKEKQEERYNSRIPSSLMGIIGYPEDIANLASFLASDDARNITGSIYLSDSGYMLKPF